VAVVVVAVIVVAFVGFVVHKKVQMDRLARERSERAKLYVAGPGARAQQVDENDAVAVARAESAAKESMGQYRAAATAAS